MIAIKIFIIMWKIKELGFWVTKLQLRVRTFIWDTFMEAIALVLIFKVIKLKFLYCFYFAVVCFL